MTRTGPRRLVSNLNSIGGLAYDVANDRLLFTDNGFELVGATNGDTVYALPNPRAVAAPIDAATLAVLPSGSIPFAQAVHALPERRHPRRRRWRVPGLDGS